jgi:diaminopimelate epimerase
MTKIIFSKFNGTGNDFIVVDNRESVVKATASSLWARLCRPKFGIGADGVLLLEKSSKADFRMRYINADGGEVEMCGNGSRVITCFAHEVLGFNKQSYTFETMNAVYESAPDEKWGYRIRMMELYDVNRFPIGHLVPGPHSLYLNTGVPHCVFEVEDVNKYPVFLKGKEIRYNSLFEAGTNSNFFQMTPEGHIRIRTYERGVENETLSCGTGATATAIACAKFYNLKDELILETNGGQLAVSFSPDFKEVFLCGKVEKIFDGSFEIP